MVIPITKQRLNNCLVAFIFVAVFNSLMFMVALAQAIQPLLLFMVWINYIICSCTNAARYTVFLSGKNSAAVIIT